MVLLLQLKPRQSTRVARFAGLQRMMETYRNNKANMNRQEKEALLYAKEKVEKAQGFIEAVKQKTPYLTGDDEGYHRYSAEILPRWR